MEKKHKEKGGDNAQGREKKKPFAEPNKRGRGLNAILAEKKGFVIMLAVALAFILVLDFCQPNPNYSQEKISAAQQLYMQNESDLNEYLQNISGEQQQPQASTLDESYLSSTKADIEWLIGKEKELYYSGSGSVYPKEAAFTLFAQRIVQLNQDYTFELGKSDYDAEIATGLAVDYNVPQMLTLDELNQAFTTGSEKALYFETLNALFGDYISAKKQFINSIDSRERRYVEAKKLVLLSYGNTNNLDENYADVNYLDGNS